MMHSLFSFMMTVLFVGSAQAYVGAISSATAETGRASVEATDSPFLNPASIPYLRGYHITSGFSSSQNALSARSQDFALALTDNLPETVVPTSLAFAQTKKDFTSEENVTRDFRLSFGNKVSKGWSAGLGFRFKDDQLPTDRYNQVNMNFGVLYAPNADLGFAAVAENIFGSQDNVPEAARLKPNWSLGTSYIYRRFLRTRFDVLSASNNSWDRPTLAAGLESYMNRWVIIRMGIQRRNEEKANAYTAGIGFAGPKFGIHYAYLTSPELESLTRHSIDLAIPIW